ncbi:MAG: S-methyl-5'-thioadenosine phosphorylase, partial [Candidatus Omnitrophica bacterium]|nr:S-methyl-5'-thioadenosine phosphorylase [Candidatus Omnitrophota bacterium]
MDIIGMTNFAEAKLAREAEICYATLAAVTDYDCWHPQHESVTIEMIIGNLNKNIDNSKKILKSVLKNIPGEKSCRCAETLKYAIVTDRKVIPAKVKKDLDIIIGKYIK